MPPEQENLNRQLEALSVTSPASSSSANAPTPRRRSRRPCPSRSRGGLRRWLGLTGLLVALALAGGVVIGAVAWSTDQPAGAKAGIAGASSATHSPDTTTVGPVATPACKTAVDQASTMLAIAVKLQRELAEYSSIMSDPANRNLPVRELLEKTLRRCRPGPASRPGSSARWPTTGRSWTSASCAPPEPERVGQVLSVAKTMMLDR